jgi:peroxiredoxin
MAKAHQEFGPKGIVFVGISLMSTEEESKKFVAEFNLAYANGRDPDRKIMTAYKVERTPTTFLISPGGKILGAKVAAFREEELTAALQRLLEFKEP